MSLFFTSLAKDASATPVATPESEVEPVGKQWDHMISILCCTCVHRAGVSGGSGQRCQVPACKVQM